MDATWKSNNIRRVAQHVQARIYCLLAAAALAVAAFPEAVAAGPSAAQATITDTAGTGIVQWAYDRWTVPWVQVKGAGGELTSASHATLMVLSCEGASLERDRSTRHLSAAECEHRMAVLRADQDTALIFRLDLRVLEFQGADEVARLKPGVSVGLEDDRGRRWSPLETTRGPVMQIEVGQRLPRFRYQPPWNRNYPGSGSIHSEVIGGRRATLAEHRLRFLRRDPRSNEPVLGSNTHWIRLRLSYAGNEWVATWPIRPVAAHEQ